MVFPSRAWEWEGEAWVAQELGLTRSGRREDVGVLLTLVGFRREGGETGGSAREPWEREAWLRHYRLTELSEVQMEELFQASTEFRPLPTEPTPFFPGLSDGERRRDRGHRGQRGSGRPGGGRGERDRGSGARGEGRRGDPGRRRSVPGGEDGSRGGER